MPKRSLIEEGEKPWQPYGTIGKVLQELPPYISRFLGISRPSKIKEDVFVRPPEFNSVIEAVGLLRRDSEHKERAHESLVEDFFVALGYTKHMEIKYRQGRVDIKVEISGRTLIIVEVKAAWGLKLESEDGIRARQQAYEYALEEGVRYVIVTNGEIYYLFDRLKGLSRESNFLGQFQLTALEEDDLALIERLRPARLGSPDVGEVLRFVGESFEASRAADTSRG